MDIWMQAADGKPVVCIFQYAGDTVEYKNP